MASTRRAVPFILLFLAFSVFALEWSDRDLADPAAADRLLAAATGLESARDAAALLRANAPRLPPNEGKRKTFSALARLQELLGEYSAAAASWTAAAYAEKGRRDDAALIESARCFISIGEFERASAAVKTVLLTGTEARDTQRARLWGAYAAAFAGEPGASDLLRVFAADPAFSADHSVVLFLLWRLFDDETARNRLLQEFPASAEALAIQGNRVGPAVGPLWVLPLHRETLRTTSRSVSPTPQETATDQAPPVVSARGGGLQVGLFRSEPNANALVSRLEGAGFKASIVSRTVDGIAYFAVVVSPGASEADTIMRLKDAGFEAFPVY